MDLWFEIVFTVYGCLFLFMEFIKVGAMVSCDEEPELTEEMRNRLYA